MENLVTVRAFTYAHEAAVAKSLLESENILCFLKDELTIQANPFYSNALGGVKLQVRERDAGLAEEILQSSEQPAAERQDTITIKNNTGELDQCPYCGSGELSLIKKPSGVFVGLSLMLLGFPLTLFSRVYHCYECGNDVKVLKNRKNEKS